MAQVVVNKDVPPGDVDQLMADFKKVGATKVEKTKQPDGNFTVTATFPN